MLFADLRMVGIPKRKGEDLRPIVVGSVMLHAWNGRIASTAPPHCSSQGYGRRNATVASAIADWLHGRRQCGAELDLAKAFDTVWLTVASTAARRGGHQEEACFLGPPVQVLDASMDCPKVVPCRWRDRGSYLSSAGPAARGPYKPRHLGQSTRYLGEETLAIAWSGCASLHGWPQSWGRQ
jgi:hypothetical protein